MVNFGVGKGEIHACIEERRNEEIFFLIRLDSQFCNKNIIHSSKMPLTLNNPFSCLSSAL